MNIKKYQIKTLFTDFIHITYVRGVCFSGNTEYGKYYKYSLKGKISEEGYIKNGQFINEYKIWRNKEKNQLLLLSIINNKFPENLKEFKQWDWMGNLIIHIKFNNAQINVIKYDTSTKLKYFNPNLLNRWVSI